MVCSCLFASFDDRVNQAFKETGEGPLINSWKSPVAAHLWMLDKSQARLNFFKEVITETESLPLDIWYFVSTATFLRTFSSSDDTNSPYRSDWFMKRSDWNSTISGSVCSLVPGPLHWTWYLAHEPGFWRVIVSTDAVAIASFLLTTAIVTPGIHFIWWRYLLYILRVVLYRRICPSATRRSRLVPVMGREFVFRLRIVAYSRPIWRISVSSDFGFLDRALLNLVPDGSGHFYREGRNFNCESRHVICNALLSQASSYCFSTALLKADL